jgi:tRNA 2-thiouridine synthesizing protein E
MYETDAEGYLVNREDWTNEFMMQAARNDGVELTSEHIKYIKNARMMFERDGTVPSIREFAKSQGMDRKAKKLYEIFESGVMKRIAKWGGLPKPTGCV